MQGHEYIIGASRSGKTNFLLSEMFERGEAFCFIDKHGQAAREIADAMPCIYWRPADRDFTIGLNPMAVSERHDRWRRVADDAAMFSDIFGLGLDTPRLLYLLRASLRLLYDNPVNPQSRRPVSSYLAVRQVLTDERYRRSLMRRDTDPETKQTWKEFDEKDARQQAQEVGSVLNKIASLAEVDPLRDILTAPRSTIDFERIIREGSVLVIDLSDLGDFPAYALGAIIINQFKQTAERMKNTRPFRLYIDEFQNFGTGIIATIAAESGKWELWLSLAHQFLSQLETTIQDAVLGNCHTIMSFRVGANDAPLIAKALDWNATDLQNLGRGIARRMTLVNGKPSYPFRIETTKTELPTGHLKRNINFTRANFAVVPRAEKRRGFEGSVGEAGEY